MDDFAENARLVLDWLRTTYATTLTAVRDDYADAVFPLVAADRLKLYPLRMAERLAALRIRTWQSLKSMALLKQLGKGEQGLVFRVKLSLRAREVLMVAKFSRFETRDLAPPNLPEAEGVLVLEEPYADAVIAFALSELRLHNVLWGVPLFYGSTPVECNKGCPRPLHTRRKARYLMTLMEETDDTLANLLERAELPELHSLMSQLLVQLAILQDRYGFAHNDLHQNNIMYRQTDEEFFAVRLGGRLYRIPSHGKAVCLIDFGRASMTVRTKSRTVRVLADTYAQGTLRPENCEAVTCLTPKKHVSMDCADGTSVLSDALLAWSTLDEICTSFKKSKSDPLWQSLHATQAGLSGLCEGAAFGKHVKACKELWRAAWDLQTRPVCGDKVRYAAVLDKLLAPYRTTKAGDEPVYEVKEK